MACLALGKHCVPVGFCDRVLDLADRRSKGCSRVFKDALSASRSHSSTSTWVSVERTRDAR